MPHTTACPSCDKTLKVASRALGRRVRCPACRAVFTIDRDSCERVVTGRVKRPDMLPLDWRRIFRLLCWVALRLDGPTDMQREMLRVIARHAGLAPETVRALKAEARRGEKLRMVERPADALVLVTGFKRLATLSDFPGEPALEEVQLLANTLGMSHADYESISQRANIRDFAGYQADFESIPEDPERHHHFSFVHRWLPRRIYGSADFFDSALFGKSPDAALRAAWNRHGHELREDTPELALIDAEDLRCKTTVLSDGRRATFLRFPEAERVPEAFYGCIVHPHGLCPGLYLTLELTWTEAGEQARVLGGWDFDNKARLRHRFFEDGPEPGLRNFVDAVEDFLEPWRMISESSLSDAWPGE